MRILIASLVLLAALPAWSQPLLFEDFEDGVADGFTPATGFWECVGGEYYCHVEGFERPGLALFGESTWTDYTVEWDQIIDAGCGDHKLQFRMQSLYDCYLFGVRAYPYAEYWLYRMNGGPLALTPIANGPIPCSIGVWHHFVLEVYGNTIAASMDGIVLFAVTHHDPGLEQGYLALSAWSGGLLDLQDTRFDNVLVMLTEPVEVETTTWGSLKALYR